MRFFVTGSSGFVGSHLVPRLLAKGPVTTLQRPDGPNPVSPGCTALQGDITEPTDLRRAPPMDVVFHLAAEASPERAAQDPERATLINVEGTRNVIDLAQRHQARLVFLSTGQVYGPSRGLPFREADALRPQGVYPTTKAAAEGLVTEATRRGLSATSLRCFNMYGPRQVGPYVVPAMMAALAKSETPNLRDLAPARDFLYIGDAVEAMVTGSVEGGRAAILNVAAGHTYTIDHVVRTASRLAGVEPPTGPFVRADVVDADISSLRHLGWTPKVPLDQGLQATLDWWRLTAKP